MSEWISVSELPADSGRYTVNSTLGVRDAYWTCGFIPGDGRWQDCESQTDDGDFTMSDEVFVVAHWMPLPSPPETQSGIEVTP